MMWLLDADIPVCSFHYKELNPKSIPVLQQYYKTHEWPSVCCYKHTVDKPNSQFCGCCFSAKYAGFLGIQISMDFEWFFIFTFC